MVDIYHSSRFCHSKEVRGKYDYYDYDYYYYYIINIAFLSDEAILRCLVYLQNLRDTAGAARGGLTPARHPGALTSVHLSAKHTYCMSKKT